LTGFTGFCWNFYDWSSAVIYAVTFTPPPMEFKSQAPSGQSVLPPSTLLQMADAALPNSITTYIGMPSEPDDIVRIGKRQTHEASEYGESEVLLDPYTGRVLHVSDSKTLPLGDRVLNSFATLHFGTFGGLPTRILYVFVGLAPAILLGTGFIMWRHRKPSGSQS
jgi:uncharacterized iron-regulated membrane protein